MHIYSLSQTGTFKNVSIDGRAPLKMQVDTGADISIIPRNFWEKLGKPTLSTFSKILRNYDNSAMKALGSLTACVELDNKYSVINLIVVDVEKRFGLLGSDVIHIETLGLHTINTTGCLEGYEAKIKIMDNAMPYFCESRPVPIHLKPSVINEIKKMEREGILEPVPEGGSAWASPIVVVRKSNGSLHICADFKAGVNSKIYNDYFLKYGQHGMVC